MTPSRKVTLTERDELRLILYVLLGLIGYLIGTAIGWSIAMGQLR